jgi:P2-related tail formation protein
MKSLLPPNATTFERALENATKFSVDAGLLNGFKFKENQQIVSYLIWEYNLNDVLEYIKDSTNFIADGLVFQRTRGTRAAINIATNWAGLDRIDVYEEIPSVHFYEFQIGVKNRQFDFDIELLKNVINLAKPVRSRLSRVYNDTYDIRHFKLDGSAFGDILSDDSGVKLHDLTLSFGRKVSESVGYDDVFTKPGITRIHEIKSAADRIYRLDFVSLDESEPDVNAIEIEYQKVRVYKSNVYEAVEIADIGRYLTFAMASIVLSESSILEDLNTCFNPLEIQEQYATFMLGEDLLSEHSWGFETRWILKRFDSENAFYKDMSDAEYSCTSPMVHRNFTKVITSENTATSVATRSSNVCARYETNPYWSGHRHPEIAWNDGIYVTRLH